MWFRTVAFNSTGQKSYCDTIYTLYYVFTKQSVLLHSGIFILINSDIYIYILQGGGVYTKDRLIIYIDTNTGWSCQKLYALVEE